MRRLVLRLDDAAADGVTVGGGIVVRGGIGLVRGMGLVLGLLVPGLVGLWEIPMGVSELVVSSLGRHDEVNQG